MEEQYIIRFPPDLSESIRERLREDKLGDVSIKLQGALFVGQDRYPIHVAKLPCVVDIHKTEDKEHYYKTGDIGQILLVQDPMTEPEVDKENYAREGLTPASKDIRKRWEDVLPTPTKEEIEEAQKEVSRVHRTGTFDFDLERVFIQDIEEIFVTSKDVTIVTFNNGRPPFRAGNPINFTNFDFELIPEHQRKLLLSHNDYGNENKSRDQIMIDSESDSEDDNGNQTHNQNEYESDSDNYNDNNNNNDNEDNGEEGSSD